MFAQSWWWTIHLQVQEWCPIPPLCVQKLGVPRPQTGPRIPISWKRWLWILGVFYYKPWEKVWFLTKDCPPIPWSSFPWCFDFPWSFLTKEIPWCFECFQLFFSIFLGVFWGSEGLKIPWCFGWFSLVFTQTPRKRRSGWGVRQKNIAESCSGLFV